MVAEVIIPIGLDRTFHYVVPAEMEKEIAVGMRVMVDFRNTRQVTGLVKSVYKDGQVSAEGLKEIRALVDSEPSFLKGQLRVWEKIGEYYQCGIGDIFKNETPSYLKMESETVVFIRDDVNTEEMKLSKSEKAVIDIASDGIGHTVKEIGTKVGVKSIMRVINGMIEKRLIYTTENVNKKYRAKWETVLRLADEVVGEKAKAMLKKAKKQEELYEYMVNNNVGRIRKGNLIESSKATATIIRELVKKGIVKEEKVRVDRIVFEKREEENIKELTKDQTRALSEIKIAMASGKRVLLHGVAYSGKTEVYVHLIEEYMENSKQVLVLLPENALTTQIAKRLANVFGESVMIYNNKLSPNEHVEVWNNILRGDEGKIIVGTHSSLFLPYKNLGLIIVDEEHDARYKQTDRAPRYHARNAALFLANDSGADVLMGSATPSVESYANTMIGKLKLVTLPHRWDESPRPQVRLIDIGEAYNTKSMKGHFSMRMANRINDMLDEKKQVILLQNRRGYASFIECKHCGHTPKCINCNVSLSVHKKEGALKCHYCNNTISLYDRCPQCGSTELNYKGFGTEQVEDEAIELFPKAVIRRMDMDTMKKKYSYEMVIKEFHNREIDILIGTQMISKGLDFYNVGLVGVLNADNMLHFPDFRAHEYAYDLLVQTAGRCARGGVDDGEVLIQTYNPHHSIFRHIVSGEYERFFGTQMTERSLFKYPPYVRLIKLSVRHENKIINQQASNIITEALRKSFGDRVLGPDYPLVEMMNGKFINNIIIKIENTGNIAHAKAIINSICTQMKQNKGYSKLKIVIDIDPI